MKPVIEVGEFLLAERLALATGSDFDDRIQHRGQALAAQFFSTRADTPLPYRLRSEIEWSAVQGRHRSWWVAKDPLRSTLFRCGDEVRELLQSLDGQRSIQDLNASRATNPSMQRFTLHAIRQIILSAIQKQLLIRCSPHALSATRPESQTSAVREPSSSFVRLLKSIQRWPWFFVQGKLRLGNAEGLLNVLAKHTNWLFGRLAVRFWSIVFVVSAMLVVNKSIEQDLFAWPNLASLESNAVSWVLILLLTRVLHELGHGIVCRRMGARCREFGLFFMLGIACPYVDVTDSWRLRDSRARMAIAAAGVYVEWIVAALAGLVWYFSQPCWLHGIAWQIMVLCSLTTLAVNANPLMRYDGYFLLSDFFEVVNLREEADAALGKVFRIGPLQESNREYEPSLTWQDCGFALYACASSIYRCTLIATLMWAVHAICARYSLVSLGWAFAALAIISFLLIPLGEKMYRNWTIARDSSNGPYRVVAWWLGCGAVIVNLAWLPLPHRIACQGIVLPNDRTIIYTQTAGRIPLALKDESDPIVSLENPALEDQMHVAIRRQRELECQIQTVRKEAYHQAAIIDRLPMLTTLIEIAKRQSRNSVEEVNALTIERPSQGSWTPIELPAIESLEESRSMMQTFTIDDPACRGRWIPNGTPIGYVTSSDRVSIGVTVPLSEFNYVQVGMAARVRLDQQPDRVYRAKIVEISDRTAIPDELVRWRMPKATTNSGDSSNTDSFLLVSLAVDDVSTRSLAMAGSAEIVIWSTPMSLYQHVSQLANATFGPIAPQTIAR